MTPDTRPVSKSTVLRGIAASPGIGIGKALVLKEEALSYIFRALSREETKKEIQRFRLAVARKPEAAELETLLRFVQEQTEHALVLETTPKLSHSFRVGVRFASALRGRTVLKEDQGPDEFIPPLDLIDKAQLELRKVTSRFHDGSLHTGAPPGTSCNRAGSCACAQR